MIFSIILSIIFICMAFYGFIFVPNKKIKFVLLTLYVVAIVFVWNPEMTTIVAHFFGIGRGLDFIFILFLVTMINGMFFMAQKLQIQNQNITKLTRDIAIQNTNDSRNVK